MECIICLNDISFNDYIITECCKQIIHIECLKSWVLFKYEDIIDEEKIFANEFNRPMIKCEVCKCAYWIENYHNYEYKPKNFR